MDKGRLVEIRSRLHELSYKCYCKDGRMCTVCLAADSLESEAIRIGGEKWRLKL